MSLFIKNNRLLIGKQKSILYPAGNNSANYNQTANWNGTTTGNVTSVGSNGGPSAYGTYDQSGNIAEWNDEIYLVSSVYNRGHLGGDYTSNSINIGRIIGFSPQSSNGSSTIGFRIVTFDDPLSYSAGGNSFVSVGDINNSAFRVNDANIVGSVGYVYKISKFLVTNFEYTIFLNSVGATDTYGIYNTNMNISPRGGIIRSGLAGSRTYATKTNFANKPVNFVSWYSAARYINWLCNNRPSGLQNSSTTEDGAYTLSGNTGIPIKNNISPNTGLAPTYLIPSVHECFKSAFYKGGSSNAGYWAYATQSDSIPQAVSSTSSGDGILL